MVETDILKVIPLTELPLLIEHLQFRLGRAHSNYMVNFIKNVLDWSTRLFSKHYADVLSPNGDWKTHCTFIGNVQMPNYSSLVIFSLEASNEQLMTGLLQTKRIDWTRPLLFAMTPKNNYPVVHRLIKEWDLGMGDDVVCYVVRIDKEVAAKFEQTCPVNTRIGQLNSSHAEIVNDEWPHKSDGSVEYIAAIIEANDNAAIFMEDTGELACWEFVSFIGALASLQTIEAHKRKGYGKVITKTLAARVAAKGWDPCATVVTHNKAPQKLFSGLGFELLSQEVTFFFTTGSKKK